MMINYKVVPKKNQFKPDDPPKYYAQVVYENKVTNAQLASKIARTTTMGVPDIKGVLAALEEEVIEALQAGSPVELGQLCSFYPSVKSNGADAENAFNVNTNIDRKSVNVRAKKKLTDKMRDVSLKRVE